MDPARKSDIDEALTARVIESVLAEIEKDESAVDRVDLLKVKQADGLVLRAILAFIDENKTVELNNNDCEAVKTITERIMKTLKWRKEYGINNLIAEDFPTAFYRTSPFKVGHNLYNKNTVILVRDESFHEKISAEWNEIVERFACYITEHATAQYFNQGKEVYYVMDFSNFGMKNLDAGLCLSFYDTIGKHYPRVSRQTFAIDLPWYAKPVMKLVLKTLPRCLSHQFQTVSLKEFTQKMDQDSLPLSMGGHNKLYFPLASPSRFVSIQEIGERNGIPQADIDRMVRHLGQE